MEGDKFLGKLVVCRTAQGDFVTAGRCICYSEAPTVTVVNAKGERTYWRADLTNVLVEDGRLNAPNTGVRGEEIAYALVPQKVETPNA
ncbi:MAG TPA: hypothetical protein VNU44_14465 [Bryobacteraceae bacterium]|jgi:hypothetical protein|nr:hypothetical protein [Bryobacteraceae bacterium]